jgi:pimeloyl-ACP methyl ester carboxylesterase
MWELFSYNKLFMSEKTVVETTSMPPNRGEDINIHREDEFLRLGALTEQKYQDKNLYTEPISLDQTIPMRAKRAQMLQEAQSLREIPAGDQENYPAHLEKYRELSKNERAYLSAEAVRVKTPEWDVVSTYTILNKDKFLSGNRPLVIISGASNGLQSVDSFALELAKSYGDRPVLVLGYPEAATQGKIDHRFLMAVIKDKGVNPHADLMEAVINHALKPLWDQNKKQAIDIVGYSAGGMIVSQLLTRPEWQSKVGKAALMCPGGACRQSISEFLNGLNTERMQIKNLINTGITEREVAGELDSLTDILNFAFINDPHLDLQKVLRLSTWMILGRRATTNLIPTLLPKMNNQDGILAVISGGKDVETKSASVYPENNNLSWGVNNQPLQSVVLPDEMHTGPFTHPTLFVDALKKVFN